MDYLFFRDSPDFADRRLHHDGLGELQRFDDRREDRLRPLLLYETTTVVCAHRFGDHGVYIQTEVRCISDFAFFVFLVSFILLIVVLVSYVELVDKPDIKRWLSVPFVGQFQPSEVAKLGLILFFAWDMERNRKRVEKSAKLTLLYGSIIFVMCVLVFKENHLSGTVLMLSIGCVMVYLGGVRLRWVILVGGALLLIAAGVLTVMWLVVHEPEKASALLPERVAAWGQEGAKVPYMIKRIISWLDKGFEPLGARWQTNQSLFALGSGGLTGKGFGNSLQKHGFLPEAQKRLYLCDCRRELGFIGALLIVGGFLALIFRDFKSPSRPIIASAI